MRCNSLRVGDLLMISKDDTLHEKWLILKIRPAGEISLRWELLFVGKNITQVEESTVLCQQPIQRTLGISGETVHVLRQGKEIFRHRQV